MLEAFTAGWQAKTGFLKPFWKHSIHLHGQVNPNSGRTCWLANCMYKYVQTFASTEKSSASFVGSNLLQPTVALVGASISAFCGRSISVRMKRWRFGFSLILFLLCALDDGSCRYICDQRLRYTGRAPHLRPFHYYIQYFRALLRTELPPILKCPLNSVKTQKPAASASPRSNNIQVPI